MTQTKLNQLIHVFIYLVLVLSAAITVGVAVALTNAGTVIVNSATVTYKNAAGQAMTPITATVTVTVQAVNRVIVVGNTNVVLPGGAKSLVYYTLTNVGNTPDTYNLTTALLGLAGANPADITVGKIFSIPSNTVGGASGAAVVATSVVSPGSSAVFAVEVSAVSAILPDLNYNINLTATSVNVVTATATGVDTVTTANYKLNLIKTIQNITQSGAVFIAPWTITIGKGDVIEYTDTLENASNGVNPIPVDKVLIQATAYSLQGASISLVALGKRPCQL